MTDSKETKLDSTTEMLATSTATATSIAEKTIEKKRSGGKIPMMKWADTMHEVHISWPFKNDSKPEVKFTSWGIECMDFNLCLSSEIEPEHCTTEISGNKVSTCIRKKNPGSWKQLVCEEDIKALKSYISINWDLYQPEEEDDNDEEYNHHSSGHQPHSFSNIPRGAKRISLSNVKTSPVKEDNKEEEEEDDEIEDVEMNKKLEDEDSEVSEYDKENDDPKHSTSS